MLTPTRADTADSELTTLFLTSRLVDRFDQTFTFLLLWDPIDENAR
jgi:hypothetical protein